jgi:isocitrate dehydrogenase
MLIHLGQSDVAERVHHAWLKTIEDGVHTYDVFAEGVSKQKVGTNALADAVIARLGQKPRHLKSVAYAGAPKLNLPAYQPRPPQKKEMVGVDVFVHARIDVETLAMKMKDAVFGEYLLTMITNRGVKVWPNGLNKTFKTDHWRCRYMSNDGKQLNGRMTAALLDRLTQAGVDVVKTENLYTFDGEPGYSLGQGQ